MFIGLDCWEIFFLQIDLWEKKNLFYIVILENCSKQKGYKNKQAETQIKDNNATEIYKHLLRYQCQLDGLLANQF